MLKFAKFTGANTDFATSQAFLFPRILPQNTSDFIFGLLVSCEGEDIFVKVRQKALNLEGIFNEPFERITDKLHELFDKLKLEFSGEGADSIGAENLKLTLFAARENLFYVMQLGDNLVEIWRTGERSPIIGGNFTQEKIVSGILKEGDRILVISSRPDGNWNEEVLLQIFNMAEENIPDAEAIFAQTQLEIEKAQDLAGVKNILPVAFIRIDSEIEGIKKETENSFVSKSESNLKIKEGLNFSLALIRKIIRQSFGAVRQFNEKALLVNRKVLIAAVVLVLLVLLVSAGFIYYQVKQASKNTRRDNLIILVEGSLTQAMAIKDTDIKAAVEELKKSAEKIKELEGIDSKNPKVSETKDKYEKVNSDILKIYKNFDLELFLSIDLIKENYKTKKISFSVGKVLVLDENEKSLVLVDLKTKTPQILAGNQQLGDGRFSSINGSDAFVYSADKGLIHIDADSEKVSVVSKPDEGWGNIEDVFGFSGNVYVLDSSKSMVWKYAPTVNGFSGKQEYLKGKYDLSLGKELIIDYSVWVLTKEPDILKFTAGNSDFYAISGLDQPLTQIDGLFVTEDLDSVFILDKSRNLILVTKKSGEYLAQYIHPEFGKVDDFFVDEEGKLIYLLIENKIFKTSLK